MMRIVLSVVLLSAFLAAHSATPAPALSPSPSVLSEMRKTNTLTCGVVREEEDYSKVSAHGNRAAFDFDLCRAISAAVLGDQGKVIFSPYPDEAKALQALLSGKVQLVASATPSFGNTVGLGIVFSPVVMIDGEGFLVLKNAGINTPKDLAGKKVCFISETTNVDNLNNYAEREDVKLIPFPFEEQGEMEAAMYTANCAAITTDVTQLANTRARFNVRAKDFDILQQIISIDPLAIAYLPGDPQLAAVVNATVAAIVQAEVSGIDAANVEQKRGSTSDSAAISYLSKNSGMATLLHLDADWAVRVIKAVGNYGELYERDLGSKSPLQISRGLNHLWSDGGLLYAPAIGNK